MKRIAKISPANKPPVICHPRFSVLAVAAAAPRPTRQNKEHPRSVKAKISAPLMDFSLAPAEYREIAQYGRTKNIQPNSNDGSQIVDVEMRCVRDF
jgi:hypothetical protein